MSGKINETAAGGSTGGGSIAVSHDRLGGMRSRMSLKDFMHRFHSKLSNRYNFHRVTMEGSITKIVESVNFPYQVDDAVSRLKSMEMSGEHEQTDVVSYGIEDDQGVMMKITVPLEQGEEFERHVAQELAAVLDFKKTGRGQDKSLAELLYELKDQFTIVSAEFPTIPKEAVYNADEISESLPEQDEFDDMEGDEEADVDIDVDGEDLPPEDEFDDEDEEIGDDFDAEEPGNKEELLTSVLAMLKSQNEKEIAQANAEAEQAKARQAELALKASKDEMQTQEQMVAAQAEMEAEKDKEKKAKEMAELAKFNYKKRMGESTSYSPLLRSVLLELDSNDTVASLRRQMAAIPLKYRIEPEDDRETQQFKRQQQQAAMREIRIKMQAAKRREDYEEQQAEKEREQQQQQDVQDPQNAQARTNDRGQQ